MCINPQTEPTLMPFCQLWYGSTVEGLSFGTGAGFDGAIMASKEVMIVTINYRLGVFGFLSLEDDVMPGNYAMMDQLMALKWVQDIAKAFGADPNSVTVFGESAGAASVSLLLLSPLAKGLFHKAILESGSALSPFSVVSPWDAISPAKLGAVISEKAGCRQHDKVDLLHCLQGLDADKIFNAAMVASMELGPQAMFKPRVENTFGFLPDYPIRLLNAGKMAFVDTLRGFNTNELFALPQDPENDGITEAEFRTGVTNTLRDNFGFLDRRMVDQMINDIYVTNISDPFIIRSHSGQFLTDLYFVAPTIKELQLTKQSNPASKTFLYQFDYLASFVDTPQWMGVLHAAEIGFVSGFSPNVKRIGNKTLSDADKLVATKMVTMWTNFAKCNNPTPLGNMSPQWKEFTERDADLLKINEHPKMVTFNDNQLLGMFNIILMESEQALAGGSGIIG